MSILFPLGEPADLDERDDRIMRKALQLAQRALDEDEVPVGALVVRNGEILGRGWNQVEQLVDATAHAEMLALTQAFAAAGEKRLEGAEVFCTLEPCLQCAGALLHARVSRVVFAASDPKFGGVHSLASLFDLEKANHKPEWKSGVLAEESAEMLKEFFRAKRAKPKDS
ncbi:MAG: nucleoside deaminase [Planctomycetota bacterium]|jgi:tRNA(adenine34) deaminase|nr:nucleoside deaminase [Planctomycetota bacterium]MDP6941810.1 nucleoside deaminase [Planctomycetota bacterium]